MRIFIIALFSGIADEDDPLIFKVRMQYHIEQTRLAARSMMHFGIIRTLIEIIDKAALAGCIYIQ